MTYALFTFVFMLMYGSFVAVLAYKAGKHKRGKMVKALNRSNRPVYFNTKDIKWVFIEDDAEKAVARIGDSDLKFRRADNAWVDEFIKDAK